MYGISVSRWLGLPDCIVVYIYGENVCYAAGINAAFCLIWSKICADGKFSQWPTRRNLYIEHYVNTAVYDRIFLYFICYCLSTDL
uniref:Uncharacterized protein n=1 Tax=Pyxicephalus adspersus TaxID=30357 RepID=A0AAV3ANP4_PYXAD|nr:TPA: hypothetical protein GDO54_000781 [Pyxicephalus adspersus]